MSVWSTTHGNGADREGQRTALGGRESWNGRKKRKKGIMCFQAHVAEAWNEVWEDRSAGGSDRLFKERSTDRRLKSLDPRQGQKQLGETSEYQNRAETP